MKQLLLSALLLWFGSITIVQSQTPSGAADPLTVVDPPPTFFLGISGGLLRSNHTGGGLPEESGMTRTVAGTDLGYSFGVVAEQALNRWLRIGGRVEFRSAPGVIYQAPFGEQVLLPESGPTAIDTATTTTLGYRELSVGIHAVAYPVQLLRGVRAVCAVGPSISANLSGTRSRYRGEVRYPSGMAFEEAAASQDRGEHTTISSDEPIAELQQFRFGVVGSVGVELQLPGIFLTPNLSYDHALTSVTSRPAESGWRVHSLGFRLDVRMEL